MTEQEALRILNVNSFDNWDRVFSQYNIQREHYLIERMQSKSDPGLAQINKDSLEQLKEAFDFFRGAQKIPDDYFPVHLNNNEKGQAAESIPFKKSLTAYMGEMLQALIHSYFLFGKRVKQKLLRWIRAAPAGIFSFLIFALIALLVFALISLLVVFL